jgi:hypothetical protein
MMDDGWAKEVCPAKAAMFSQINTHPPLLEAQQPCRRVEKTSDSRKG